MKYFLLGLTTLILPLYNTITWLLIFFSGNYSSQSSRIVQHKRLNFTVYENSQYMGVMLFVLCVISILFFSKSRNIAQKLKPIAFSLMILSGFIALFQGWTLL